MAFSEWAIEADALYDSHVGAPFVAIPHALRALYVEGFVGANSDLGMIRKDTSELTGHGGTYRGDGLLTSFVRVYGTISSSVSLWVRVRHADPLTIPLAPTSGYELRLTRDHATNDDYTATLYDWSTGVAVQVATDAAVVLGVEWANLGIQVYSDGLNDKILCKWDNTATPGLAWASWSTTLFGLQTVVGPANRTGMAGVGTELKLGATIYAGFDYIRFQEE